VIRVLFFGALADIAGREQLDLTWQPSLDSPAAIRLALAASAPALERALQQPQMLVARNLDQAGWDTPVADGDEIAFMPPVTGG